MRDSAQPQLAAPVRDWVETHASDQLDDLAAAYDPDADIPLRGESLRLSLTSLAEDCEDGEAFVDGLIDDVDVIRNSIHMAISKAVAERREEIDYLDETLEDGWCIEWVDPIDEMHIDISEALSKRTGEMVAIRGRVRQRTDPVPWFRTRTYQCVRCFATSGEFDHYPGDVVRGQVRSPYECIDETCAAGQSDFALLPEESDKRDYQYITVEQSPDADGSTPSKIGCWLFNEGRLTDAAEGERVTVTGYLRLNPDADPAEHYIDVSAVVTDSEDSTVEVTEDDRERVHDLVAETANPLETAAENLAPHVHGHDLAKRGLVLAAVGSGLDDAEEQTHVMLIGDPGTAKTELTKAVREVVPSTRKASLTQSSSVGLTASAVKESVGGSEEWVIRAGALSLASGGILTIDELDEADFDLSKLNDALSEGEIPVDKAGESTRIKTDTRVIATANPEDAEFDPEADLGEQIQFSADVVSRFDLAFPFIDDSSDEEMNEGIMQATGADYLAEDEMTEEYAAYTRDLNLETLQQWIAVAQEQQPTITADAMDEIRDAWMLLRNAQDAGVISINARRLRTVVRLARAHARLRLGDEVTPEDAKTAMRVVSAMLGEWGYDITGESGSDDESDSDDDPDRSELDDYDGDSTSLSDREREAVAELARDTEMTVEEIRREVRVPAEAREAVQSAVEDARGESIGEVVSKPQDAANSAGDADD